MLAHVQEYTNTALDPPPKRFGLYEDSSLVGSGPQATGPLHFFAPRASGWTSRPLPKVVKSQRTFRVWSYRIVYRIDDEEASVLVLVIGHRREVYDG